jgi:Oxidoreductase family, C-terminal alpha/beta domain
VPALQYTTTGGRDVTKWVGSNPIPRVAAGLELLCRVRLHGLAITPFTGDNHSESFHFELAAAEIVMHTHHNRRAFIGASAAGLSLALGRTGQAAPSERVRIAVIGLKNRGFDHAKFFSANPQAEVVAVCDIDDAMFARSVKAVEGATGKAPRIEKDFRRLLDDKTEFPHACLVSEYRIWSDHPSDGSLFGVAFLGEQGTLVIDDKGWRVEQGDGAKGPRRDKGQAKHVQNFLDCVKSRGRPNAGIETGHLSTRLCLMGNIAQRTAKKLTFDAATESFHDDAADALLAREYSNRFEMPSHV